MPLPLSDRLRDLETDVRDLRVLPAAAVRARGRSRARRQWAAGAAAAVVVAATAGLTVNALRPDQANPVQPAPVADRPATVTCVLSLPDDPAAVRIRVLDGGAPTGRADATADGFRERSFGVLPGAATPTEPLTGNSATVGYGPAAIGDATLVRAYLGQDAALRFDPTRTDDIVDVTVGRAFERLATTTEVNQALVEAGAPSAPPQCTPPGR